jgi:ABC-type Fe3+/spermidine/putrescine transport system ATPase subunit
MTKPNAIEVQNLKKAFGDFQAVLGVTFAAAQGEVLSLLGPNGAGKSTTISMLSGLLRPNSGDAAIMGHSICTAPETAKASLGVVPQDIALYPDLSARENLIFWGKMYGLREPLGTLAMAVALGLWVASVGLLIGVLAKGEDQVTLFSLIAMFVFSALGGTWFPLEGAGSAFATVGRLMPSAWAMNGFQNILIRGLSLSSVALPAGILLAYALVFFGAAVWRFRKMAV